MHAHGAARRTEDVDPLTSRRRLPLWSAWRAGHARKAACLPVTARPTAGR